MTVKKTKTVKKARAKNNNVTEDGPGQEYTVPPAGVPFRRIYERWFHPDHPDIPLTRIKFVRTDK